VALSRPIRCARTGDMPVHHCKLVEILQEKAALPDAIRDFGSAEIITTIQDLAMKT